MTATAFDIILKMFNRYICIRVLYENAIDMMYCSTTEMGVGYWREKRDGFFSELVAVEDVFKVIGVPYFELYSQWLDYRDNPCEKQAKVCAQILLELVH